MRLDSAEKMFPVSCKLVGGCAGRVKLTVGRLHDPELYAPDTMFRRNADAWPGDFPGRLMLAWHKYSLITQQIDADLVKASAIYDAECNESGFFGQIYPADLIDEQQLAGHGWMLRALAEMYTASPQEIYRRRAWKIFENLALPLEKHLSTYPLNDGLRNANGAVDGSADRRVGVWQLSTDVGAVFIFFAGLVHATEVFQLPAADLLAEFTALAHKVEFLKSKYQTHASLTLARALLRYSTLYNDESAAMQAQNIYTLYRNHAMSANGANYNWFCRPEWTEPCAVVDSFMVAMELYRRSGNELYLADAHKIWFSAFSRAQRPNGGFGGDNCPRAEEDKLYMKFYEAVNCCNMRSAEGFYEAALRGMYRQDGILFITLPLPGVFTFADGLSVEVKTNYPNGDIWSVEFLSGSDSSIKAVRCFIYGCGYLESSGSRNEFELKKHFSGDGKSFTLYRGAVMYGADSGNALHPVSDLYLLDDDKTRNLELKVIFENNQ